MADSLHSIQINAHTSKVFDAITQPNGIQHWWTDSCEMAKREGDACRFWFDGKSTCFTMLAQKLLPSQRVFWLCQDGPNEWVDTELWWEITPVDNHSCRLDFKHMNWRSDEGMFPLCNTTWGALMHQLKRYCESGEGMPLFKN